MTARPLIALVALLALLATAPAVTAQVPEAPEAPEPHLEYLQLALRTEGGYTEVEWKDRAYMPFTIQDNSLDAAGNQGYPHVVSIDTEIVTPGVKGWAVSAAPSGFITRGGETVEGNIIIDAGPATELPHITVRVTATLYGYGGESVQQTAEVMARLKPYHYGYIYITEAPPSDLKPYEFHQLDIEVANLGPYPDTFLLNATAPEGWTVSVPDRLSLLPGERRAIEATIVAPHDKLYYWSESAVYTFSIRSALDPTDPPVTKPYIATVRGAYVPGHAEPVGWLLLVLFGAVAIERMERTERARKERGPPRRPKPTPRQQVLLKELKRRDPEAFREKKAALAAAYAKRKRAYRALKAKREKRERLLKKKAQKQAERRRAERKRREKARRAAEKRVEKLRKEKEKRHRALAKARKKREAKAAKRREKAARKEAKRRERAAQREAKRRVRREGRWGPGRLKAWRERRAAKAKQKKLERLRDKKAKRLKKLKAKKRKEIERKRKRLERARRRDKDSE